MEILITNDDGWGAEGIVALTDAMRLLGHVTVVAPEGPRSGMSNAISVNKPMTLRRLTDPEREDVAIYVTNGTPSDCMKLALDGLFGSNPKNIDLVVSGINHGYNASINCIYSGTMGAALIGAEHNIPSIGFSFAEETEHIDLSYFMPLLPKVMELLQETGWPENVCYNVNVPTGAIKGIRWTRQCKGHWTEEIVQRGEENGELLYWLTGYYVNDEPQATDTDQWALAHGYISIQPCGVDLTHYPSLPEKRDVQI